MSRKAIAEAVTEDIYREATQRFNEHAASAPAEIAALLNFPPLRTAFEELFKAGYAEGMVRGREFERKVDKAIRESN